MRDLAIVVLMGVMCGCSDSGGSSGTGGTGGGGGGGGAPLPAEYVLDDPELVPESGTFDPVTRSFYVGSAQEGSVTRVDTDNTQTIFYAPPADEDWRTLGMVADVEARRLWVCAREEVTDGIPRERIWMFDLSTGERTLDLDLAGAAEGSTCNDIALDSEGLAYISDSANPRVYRANAEDEIVEIWADDPLLAPDSGIFGGNGIAVTEDDQYVLLSKTLLSTMTPRLLRIERADPDNIAGITTTPEILMIADGMSFLGGHLYLAAVGSGDILRLTSDDDWATATIAISMQTVGTSTVRPAEGNLYGIYSDITRFLLNQPLNPPFRIYRIGLDSFE